MPSRAPIVHGTPGMCGWDDARVRVAASGAPPVANHGVPAALVEMLARPIHVTLANGRFETHLGGDGNRRRRLRADQSLERGIPLPRERNASGRAD